VKVPESKELSMSRRIASLRRLTEWGLQTQKQMMMADLDLLEFLFKQIEKLTEERYRLFGYHAWLARENGEDLSRVFKGMTDCLAKYRGIDPEFDTRVKTLLEQYDAKSGVVS
jgi:DUF1365 family protein